MDGAINKGVRGPTRILHIEPVLERTRCTSEPLYVYCPEPRYRRLIRLSGDANPPLFALVTAIKGRTGRREKLPVPTGDSYDDTSPFLRSAADR